MKENPLALPKVPNKELLEHEKKRKVEAKLYKLKKEMTADKVDETEIKTKIEEERKKFYA